MGGKSSKNPPLQTHPLQSVPVPPGNFGRFPVAFALYFSGQSSKIKDEFYYLAELNLKNGQPQPLNIAVIHRGGRAKHQITIHSGPRPDSTPLALAGPEKAFRSTSVIALPAYGDGYSGAPGNQLVRLIAGGGLRESFFTFDLMVGQAGQQKVETFEWKSDHLWKAKPGKLFQRELVRLKSIGEREVVGRWVEEGKPGDSGRLGAFHFQGSGATDIIYGRFGADIMIHGAAKLAGFGAGFVG